MVNPSSPSDLHLLMKRFAVYPQKRWGQNFLVDGNILSNIAAASGAGDDRYTVEIGPGMGALTGLLAQRSRGLLAIEIDTRLEAPLREVLQPFDNVRLHFADILEIDLEQELASRFGLSQVPDYVVCANIPYNITTPIIFKLLGNCPHLKSATLMMQKEVADRILAAPGSKDYGLLTLMTRYCADACLLMKVSRHCFYPRPDVDSAVVRFTPLDEPRVAVHEGQFRGFAKLAFQMRRKTILNSSCAFFKMDKATVQSRLREIGVEPNQRPEELSLEIFAAIVNRLSR